LKTQMCGEHK